LVGVALLVQIKDIGSLIAATREWPDGVINVERSPPQTECRSGWPKVHAGRKPRSEHLHSAAVLGQNLIVGQ
jgi:hypothetical protein